MAKTSRVIRGNDLGRVKKMIKAIDMIRKMDVRSIQRQETPDTVVIQFADSRGVDSALNKVLDRASELVQLRQ